MLVYKGNDVIGAHPTRVDNYLNKGWTLEKPQSKKSLKKREVVAIPQIKKTTKKEGEQWA